MEVETNVIYILHIYIKNQFILINSSKVLNAFNTIVKDIHDFNALNT